MPSPHFSGHIGKYSGTSNNGLVIQIKDLTSEERINLEVPWLNDHFPFVLMSLTSEEDTYSDEMDGTKRGGSTALPLLI
jgi:hypothetical protein